MGLGGVWAVYDKTNSSAGTDEGRYLVGRINIAVMGVKWSGQ